MRFLTAFGMTARGGDSVQHRMHAADSVIPIERKRLIPVSGTGESPYAEHLTWDSSQARNDNMGGQMLAVAGGRARRPAPTVRRYHHQMRHTNIYRRRARHPFTPKSFAFRGPRTLTRRSTWMHVYGKRGAGTACHSERQRRICRRRGGEQLHRRLFSGSYAVRYSAARIGIRALRFGTIIVKMRHTNIYRRRVPYP